MFRLYIFFAIDTEFLESFVKVVEHGSVAEAARRLNLTAAAVTQRLRALEREIGTALVSRSGRNMRATEAGAAILAQSEQLLRSVRDLRTTANEQNFAGELSLAIREQHHRQGVEHRGS
jgi:DNA-binding transcriptional LysR family regulator